MKTAILQSNYMPWKGYFDIINSVDVFIFHDDLQYTKNDWRNRNKIKTPNGLQWITVPCGSNEKRLICEVELGDHSWQKRHWRLICENYSKAPFFDDYKEFFEQFYLGQKWTNLSEMNQHCIQQISRELLGITTTFDDSRKYGLKERKGHRVMELLQKVQSTHYVSGPAAKGYLSEEAFKKIGIKIEWADYSALQCYPQFYPPFEHSVSIIDTIFHTGSALFKVKGQSTR